MIGTGGFIVMFLVGLSLGHAFGLHVITTLLLSLLSGAAGASLVAQAERRDRGP